MPLEDHAAWQVGRYAVHGELASGGMATVHIGRMGGAGGFAKLVAIKRMHPQFAKDPDFLAMFLDEARLATRIRHPNVVQSLDVIVERGEVLLVMEYIHGDALSRINRALRSKSERIPLRIAVAIMSGVLHGLHAAHEAKSEKGEPLGIVHRDVSPQNVIVGVDGVARVLDFGIAKAADQVHLTREGELKGKLIYMAPEQLLGEPLTRRTDIFAASVVLWECLTGQRLFESDSQTALLARARMQKVDPPSELAPEISPVLDDIVLKGLALQSSSRWSTAREMALALEDAVPPATTAQVGVWVEQVAAKVLAERQARIDEIESAGADSSARSRELVADIASDRVFTQDILSARSASGARPFPPPPPPPSAQSGSQPKSNTPTPLSRRSDRASFDRLSGPPLPPPQAPVPSGLPAPARPTPLSVRRDEFYVPPAGDVSVPLAPMSLDAPAIPMEHAKPAKTHVQKISRGRVGTVIVLLMLLLFAGVVLGAPSFVRKSFVESLAQRGLVVTVDECDLYAQVGTARLVGVTVTSPDVPGASAHIHEALVDLDGSLEPKAIILRDVDVNVGVGYASLFKSLDGWSKKHGNGSVFGFPAAVRRARIESGHIAWNQPSGVGTHLEARSLTLDMTPKEGRPLGEDFQIDPTSLDVVTPLGPMGPWLFSASRTGSAYTFNLSFNQAHQQSFGLDITGSDGAAKVDLRAARATLADVNVKPDTFGVPPADPPKFDITMHAERKGAVWNGTVNALIESFHVPGAHAAPLNAEFAFAGAPGAALDVQRGRFALGSGDAPLAGTIAILDDAVLLKVASTVPLKCDDGTVRAPLSLSIDSRDIGAASLAPATRLCPPRK